MVANCPRFGFRCSLPTAHCPLRCGVSVLSKSDCGSEEASNQATGQDAVTVYRMIADTRRCGPHPRGVRNKPPSHDRRHGSSRSGARAAHCLRRGNRPGAASARCSRATGTARRRRSTRIAVMGKRSAEQQEIHEAVFIPPYQPGPGPGAVVGKPLHPNLCLSTGTLQTELIGQTLFQRSQERLCFLIGDGFHFLWRSDQHLRHPKREDRQGNGPVSHRTFNPG
jgi:hypothetical protein